MKPNAELLHRIERLERANKIWKFAALGVSLVVTGLVTMAQTRQNKPSIPRIIEAEQFVVKDASGANVATLGMSNGGPALELKQTMSEKAQKIGAAATVETNIRAGVLSMHGYDTGGKSDSSLFLTRGAISFNKGDEMVSRASMSVVPAITIRDDQGFQTVIGQTELQTVRTGESQKRSAASVVIFDSSGNVVWKVPM